jgi:hypothetical protein
MPFYIFDLYFNIFFLASVVFGEFYFELAFEEI